MVVRNEGANQEIISQLGRQYRLNPGDEVKIDVITERSLEHVKANDSLVLEGKVTIVQLVNFIDYNTIGTESFGEAESDTGDETSISEDEEIEVGDDVVEEDSDTEDESLEEEDIEEESETVVEDESETVVEDEFSTYLASYIDVTEDDVDDAFLKSELVEFANNRGIKTAGLNKADIIKELLDN